jgi:hypothetical protein
VLEPTSQNSRTIPFFTMICMMNHFKFL